MTPPAQDAGLDAVEIPRGNLTLFSITTNVFSEKLGVMLTSGDLLSDAGLILYSNQQLLAAFQPNPKDQNYGLAAFHAWYTPMASLSEVWFCTEKGFDSVLGPIAAGDLLSSAGYIVYRNLELVAKFQPMEDLADFGLDGLFLVQEPQQENPICRLTAAASPSGFMLQWETTGRVSQVDRASDVRRPFPAGEPHSARPGMVGHGGGSERRCPPFTGCGSGEQAAAELDAQPAATFSCSSLPPVACNGQARSPPWQTVSG